MKESFIKFKRKILLERMIKNFVFCFSLCLILFSIPYIYIKINDISFNLLWVLLISLGISIVLFVLLQFVFRPSDKKIAKKIDNELSLNEKVQTMIEYENENGNIIEIQREDTLNILHNTPLKKMTMKFSIFLSILLVLAMSLCITSFAIPSNNDSTDQHNNQTIVDPDYDLDNWTIRAILDLIEEVEKTTFNESLKTVYVNLLYGLIDELEDSSKQTQMKEIVNVLVDKILFELDIVNTNNEIYTVLKESDFSDIMTLAQKINNLELLDVGHLIDGVKIIILGESPKDAIIELDDEFGKLLRNSNLDKNDEVVSLLLEFTDKLKECSSKSDVIESVNTVVDEYNYKIIEALSKQLDNKKVANYIIKKLSDIFGLEIDKEDTNFDPNHSTTLPDEGEEDEEDDITQDNFGGLGRGDILLGSDDSFFDPDEGKLVYGDVLSKYQNDIINKLNDGLIPEELREYFEYYFEILMGTNKDTE